MLTGFKRLHAPLIDTMKNKLKITHILGEHFSHWLLSNRTELDQNIYFVKTIYSN